MHQLVQEVTRIVIGEPGIPLRYEAAVGLLLASMGEDRSILPPDALTPHVAVAVRFADQANADPFVTSYLATWLGNRHYEYGDLAAADSYLRQAHRMAVECSLPPAVLPGVLREVVKVRRAAGDIDEALAAADEWADAAQAAGSDLDEFHARFARLATLAYAARFRQAADEQSALAARMELGELTVSDSIMALSVQAEIKRGLGDTEGSLVLINQAIRLARDETTGLSRADHMAALCSQASALERDLGHLQTAVERQREAVSATSELRIPMVLASQLQVLASRLIDNEDIEEATTALNEASEIAEAQGQKDQLLQDFLQTAGRISLAAGDPTTAVRQLSEAIPLLEEKGEHYRGDLAATWYNLATAQMSLSQYATAASSYLKARNIETGLYGENHPDLIPTECHLAIALNMSGDRQAATDAINRCLRIVRKSGKQGRFWRNRVLTVAIAIDLGEELVSI
jgi:tetratricopeptide (TPR) repeat protein